jgi:hypothetical protein
MKLKTFLAATVVALGLSVTGMAQAATISAEVFAKKHSSVFGTGLYTGVMLEEGTEFKIVTDVLDTWSIGKKAIHTSNAGGVVKQRFYSYGGQEFNHGTLIGRIGQGVYFEIGTFFKGVAKNAGELRLFAWDGYSKDNSGSITADISVSPIPLPAGAPLLLAGLAALGLLRRRKA